MKNRLVGVTGLTSVGKDYLLEAANHDRRVATYNLGTVIGELLAMDRDRMMEAASPDAIRQAQFSAYDYVVDRQPAVVTCHAIRPKPSGELGFDEEMEAVFNPEAYIFVSAPAELIRERVVQRNSSGERKSPELSIQQIDEEQTAKLEKVKELAHHLSTRLVIVENTDEHFAANVGIIGHEIDQLITTPITGGQTDA